MKRNTTWAVPLLIGFVSAALAQHGTPNIYGPGQQWGELPNGRTWGSSSGVYPHRDNSGALTGNIWVFERCGGGNCLDSDLDPIMLFDLDGKLIQSFGAGLFVWPHGVHIDRQGNLWVADAVQSYCEPVDGKGQGHQVRKFSPEGELLMELGTAGMHNQVRQWTEQGVLASLLDILLDRGFAVFLTADHGNIEASGCGRPAEGSLADLRGERVRIFNDASLRTRVRDRFPDAIAWPSIGLPNDYLPLLAPHRAAFVRENDTLVGHGGITVEEVIVPLVRIERK